MRATSFLLFCASLSLVAPASAQTVAMKSFDVPKNITLQTGDSWVSNGQLYRLYGVQSCLRGTTAVAVDGSKTDCGDLSLAQLGAILTTSTVSCQPIGSANDNAIFTVCVASLSGSALDIGTALISSGYAFAATYPDGTPVDMNYLVAELTAKGTGAGLWAFKFPHPVQALLNGQQARKEIKP